MVISFPCTNHLRDNKFLPYLANMRPDLSLQGYPVDLVLVLEFLLLSQTFLNVYKLILVYLMYLLSFAHNSWILFHIFVKLH